ncbi:MAG: LysR family transcriptional regulator, low CO2-responsive transcriptional regulator [Chloroflexota bacterium]|jgi:LysR family hydrogen peroxide-inducible transcriptional activator|nr:LysR family transcriptional regulator, low CO2-responsive transcriptional regulator [Chloroflexota bacterium]
MMDLDVDLLSLRIFLAICDEGSFAKAAHKLFLSEPAVSVRMRILEERLGFTLFVRSRGGAEPTHAGRSFQTVATRLLQELQDAVEETRATARRIAARVTLWCAEGTASYVLPELLPQFVEQHAHIEVVTRSGRPQQVLPDLIHGQLDCALYADLVVPSLKGYELTPCFRGPIGLALTPDHPLAARRCLVSEDLAGQRLLSNERTTGYLALVREALARHGVRPGEVYPVESLDARRVLCERGFGVAFFPLVTVLEAVARGELAFRPLELAPGRLVEVTTWFCFARTHTLRAELRDMRDLATASAVGLQAKVDAAVAAVGGGTLLIGADDARGRPRALDSETSATSPGTSALPTPG